MIADQNFNDTCFAIIYPTASATVYGRRPKFFRATVEGKNCGYGPTLKMPVSNKAAKLLFNDYTLSFV